MASTTKPVVLIVRDGWGKNPNPAHNDFNAIHLAKTPRCDQLLADYPWTLIHTSGEDVGLPDSTMGNSEVGHQNIGAGRIVDQESVRITKAIRTGEFFKNQTMIDAIQKAQSADRYVHLMGIASDAGVHGMIDHLYACLELCKRCGHKRVALHLITDGRDTGPFTGKGFIAQIQAKCDELGVGKIATICGRYYAMDRDNRWERVEQAYRCFTANHAGQTKPALAPTAEQAVQQYYDNPETDSQQGDEFITPTMIGESTDDAIASRFSDGDTVIFYNYRGDRPREIIKALMYEDQAWTNVPPSPDSGNNGFDRGKKLTLEMVTMAAYEQGLPVKVAFPKLPKMHDIAGQVLSERGLTQFRCAETEKFPHVTFFFNDYREEPFPGESRKMAQSPRVPTYDLQPEMSAHEICALVVDRINSDQCDDFILVNFANGDMVGHTGKLDAAIKAVETVDTCTGKIVDAALAAGGSVIVTADHGNAEQMFDPDTGSPHTAHTIYDVECIVIDQRFKNDSGIRLRKGGRLADLLPTALDLLSISKPDAMTGESLIQNSPIAT